MGKKIFIAPIYGLELTEAVNNEYRIIRTLLVSNSKLRRKRKQFGIAQPISKLPVKQREYFFDVSDTFAIIFHSDKITEENIVRESLKILKAELSLLALSNLQYKRRGEIVNPSIMSDQYINTYNYSITEIKDDNADGKIKVFALRGPYRLFH